MSDRLPLGKLPPPLLARLLGNLPGDASVLVPARPGVDAAAVRIGDRVLIATSDPITFPVERPGWYAVNVNANDIAVMGGEPRWFLATVLLPEGVTEQVATAILADLSAACAELGVALIGGHTEVTYGLDRPLIAGTMLGEAASGRVITSAGMLPGDILIVAGGIAIEGAAALAGEARESLLAAGVAIETLERASRLLADPGISVVRAARILRGVVAVHAMHDATEGGLATALREMADASATGLAVEAAAVPVLPETRALCGALALDPLGLLASGCLIAAVAEEDGARAVAALREAGILAAAIGRVAAAGEGILLIEDGRAATLPVFARDELARWLDERPR